MLSSSMAIVISTSVSRPHTTTALDGDVVHVALVVELCLGHEPPLPKYVSLHSLKDRSHAAEEAPIWSERAAPATGALGRRRPAGEAGGHGPPLQSVCGQRRGKVRTMQLAFIAIYGQQEVLFLARWLAPRAPPPAGA